MSTKRHIGDRLSRRTALSGAATVGVGVPLLAACGGGSATDPTSSDSGSAAGSAAGPLAATGDIKVGGGEVFADQKVVVTQPTAGDFKCFTAVCTHTGCLVGEVTAEGIRCPCHGSLYSSEDGSVISGPAPRALDAVAISVVGDQISVT